MNHPKHGFLPVTQPFLPPLEEFIPYLEEIWENKWVTNDGPFHRQLEAELSAYLGIEHLSLDDARSVMGPFADALACDLQIDSAKATRELDWQPHRPTLLEELSNTTVI